ncbi:hypothetical protein [Streptomyces sp. NPDC001816]|uniref:hypothetical protein n=1 Tax=Streptomyces sp. NPDC001816 TaxID=3364612 RepID=UPI0036A3099A
MADLPAGRLRREWRLRREHSVLKRVGFYATAEEVLELKGPVAVSAEDTIVRYLEEGELLVATDSWVDDLVDPDIKRICQYSIRTDGVWVWPSSLVYYLVRYHTELPDDFLRHMDASGWTVPTLDEAALDAVMDQFMLEESLDPEEPDA